MDVQTVIPCLERLFSVLMNLCTVLQRLNLDGLWNEFSDFCGGLYLASNCHKYRLKILMMDVSTEQEVVLNSHVMS